MINADEALRIILESTRLLGTERVDLLNCSGRTLAKSIVSKENLPPFDNSSMDGIAVRSSDLSHPSSGQPIRLEIVGEASAGNVFRGALRSGQCARVMTGGRIPDGADAVVPIEQVKSLDEKFIECSGPVRPGEYIRRAGEDIRKGEVALQDGEIITAAHAGVLASLGIARPLVVHRPRVNIVSTGDELVEIDRKPGPGQIRNSTAYALEAYVREAGGKPHILGIARDRKKKITRMIEKGLEGDILLITGGVSVGKYDFVKEVLDALDVNRKFWRVNIKPGKPLVFGTLKKTLVFGLPGNPVSTSVTFLEFVRPAIWKMLHRKALVPEKLSAIFDDRLTKTDGKRHFLRGVFTHRDGTMHVKLTGTQSSGVMSSLMKANCLIVIPEDVAQLNPGNQVQIELLK